MNLYQPKTEKFPAMQYTAGAEQDIIQGLRDQGYAAMFREELTVKVEGQDPVTYPSAIVIQEFEGAYPNTLTALEGQWVAVSGKYVHVWDDDQFQKNFEKVEDA